MYKENERLDIDRKRKGPRIVPYPMGGVSGVGRAVSSTTPTTRSLAVNGNLLVTDEYLLLDLTADRAIALDTPTGKKVYHISITTGNGVATFTPASGTVNGQATFDVSGAGTGYTVLFDETNWFIW